MEQRDYPPPDQGIPSSSSSKKLISLSSNVSSLTANESEISCASLASQRVSDRASELTSIGEEVSQPRISNLQFDCTSSSRASEGTSIGEEASDAPYDWTSSSIGFKLLQKSGWKEGTGLGKAEQGRLEPLEAHVKYDKRGIGAEKVAKRRKDIILKQACKSHDSHKSRHAKSEFRRAKKALENEKRRQEQIFQADFLKEFWPENV